MPTPKLKYILYADQSAQEPDTKKWTLSGLFEVIRLVFPVDTKASATPRFVTFIKVAGVGKGNIKSTIAILNPKGEAMIAGEGLTDVRKEGDMDLVVSWPPFVVEKKNLGQCLIEINVDGHKLTGVKNFPLTLEEQPTNVK